MIRYIYKDSNFDEKLLELRRQGGTSSAVTKKADEIIKKLLSNARSSPFEIGRLTRKGEQRIKNCKKYNLGNGYRMICLKDGNSLIFLYIGTHDECTRWLERNKDLKYELDNATCTLISKSLKPDDSVHNEEIDYAEEYEKQLLEKIDDKILRKIFCGLCEKS
jgi:hypothetical protein